MGPEVAQEAIRLFGPNSPWSTALGLLGIRGAENFYNFTLNVALPSTIGVLLGIALISSSLYCLYLLARRVK
jgi:hypothetical protein